MRTCGGKLASTAPASTRGVRELMDECFCQPAIWLSSSRVLLIHCFWKVPAALSPSHPQQ